jgi:hypothetical protein
MLFLLVFLPLSSPWISSVSIPQSQVRNPQPATISITIFGAEFCNHIPFHDIAVPFMPVNNISRPFITFPDSLFPYMTVYYLSWQLVTFFDSLLPFMTVYYLSPQFFTLHDIYYLSRHFITDHDSLLLFATVYYLSHQFFFFISILPTVKKSITRFCKSSVAPSCGPSS